MSVNRWNRSISHQGKSANQFIQDYFSDRTVFLIAGAGFDPRSTAVAEAVSNACSNPLAGLLIREERANPDSLQLVAAGNHQTRLQELVPNNTALPIQIFSADNAVTGGIQAARAVANLDLQGITDVVVDVSALSLGISFPVARVLCELLPQGAQPNLHVMFVSEPSTDQEIESTAGDQVTTVHGYKGGLGLDSNNDAAKLWLPLLFRKQRSVLDKIHSFVEPDETCPVLPFPCLNPRLPDELIQYYGESFESSWEVDPKNLVFADEQKPLDIYRTILRIDDARRQVFQDVCGSMTVLTPIGSKVLAIGAMLAAIERDFPVVYIESIDYRVDLDKLQQLRQGTGDIGHVWISGEAYASINDTEGIVS